MAVRPRKRCERGQQRRQRLGVVRHVAGQHQVEWRSEVRHRVAPPQLCRCGTVAELVALLRIIISLLKPSHARIVYTWIW